MTSPDAPRVAGWFTDGATHRWERGVVSRVEVVDAGQVTLPTGCIVPRDPFLWVDDDSARTEALTTTLPAGHYPVSVSVVHWDEPPSAEFQAPLRRITAVRLMVSDRSVDSWELGLTADQDPARVSEDEVLGFGIDGNLGCIMDASALPYLRQMQDEWEPLAELAGRVLGDGTEVVDIPAIGAGLLVFTCGMGAGMYQTWIGKDAHGEPVSILIDLELLSRSLGPVEVS